MALAHVAERIAKGGKETIEIGDVIPRSINQMGERSQNLINDLAEMMAEAKA